MRKLVGMRRLKPKESYLLFSSVVSTVAHLHQNGYTLKGSIDPDSIIAMIENEVTWQYRFKNRRNHHTTGSFRTYFYGLNCNA